MLIATFYKSYRPYSKNIMNRSPETQQMESVSTQTKPKSNESNIFELIKHHPFSKSLSHEKLTTLKNYMEEREKGKLARNIRYACKSFIDKMSPQMLDILVDITYKQFVLFLRHQKRADDQKMKRLMSLVTDKGEPKDRQYDWRSPLQKYFEHEKSRNTKKNWR